MASTHVYNATSREPPVVPQADSVAECLDASANLTITATPLTNGNQGPYAVVFDDVLSPAECQRLIAFTERTNGYEAALVNDGNGRQAYLPDMRTCDRCMIDDGAAAKVLWERLRPHLPTEFHGASLIEINERLRFLRYSPGHEFKSHFDGCYRRANGDVSVLTVQFYLNEVTKGGETSMVLGTEEHFVEPKVGRAVVFQHRGVLHAGEPVFAGRKYTIRSDIMSRPA
ncbi:hypothetical protein ACHHYP_12602 [Achlya hypogyna]|uniref:Prolyl 4-hydroxylase alpha subunit domain-containing protein n=1 Tax=Achlya hypogyna TaxID=1202772 RepID=A0A1V9YGM2_ACHHY|nr:hypothetical protein ACHHYP_12602 [Achlya hypogyna]